MGEVLIRMGHLKEQSVKSVRAIIAEPSSYYHVSCMNESLFIFAMSDL